MVELPYKGDRIVMQVLLPIEKDGLKELEEKLMNQNIQKLFDDADYKKVKIQLPKFKLEQTIPLTEHLTNLGMKDMFSKGLADFSGIDGSKELYVSTVLQKAFLEVNESGTEAAAVTILPATGCCAPSKLTEFTADHPFIFYLRDKLTGMLLFQGRVNDPTK